MTVIDYPRPSRLANLLEGKRGSRIINFIVIPLLLIAALLLPPISLIQRFSGMGYERISDAGGTLTTTDGTQVTFLPGTVKQPFGAALSAVPRVSFLEGSAGKELLAAAKAIPPQLVAKSPFYQLKTNGDATSETVWVMPIPNDSEPYETLDIYTWDAAKQNWQWLPHHIIAEDDQIESRVPAVPASALIVQTNPKPPVLGLDLGPAAALPADGKGAVGQVHPTGLYLGAGGGIDGALDANWDRLANTYEIVPVIRNYEGPIVRSDLLANMLVDGKQRDSHINALVSLAVGNLYKGIDVDYRGLDPNLRGEFNQFIAALAEKLHAQNKTLAVRVEPASQVAEDRWDTGPYDWYPLGLLADTVKIPAPVDPRSYAPDGQLDALLSYAVGQINRDKVQPVFSGQSIEQAGSYLLRRGYADALQPLLGRIQTDPTVVEPGKPLNLALVSTRPTSGLIYDPNIGTYVYRYQDDQGNARTVWLENAASLSHKLELLKRYNIQGVTIERMPADGQDADLWRLMRDYQQGRSVPIDSNFAVQWTIKGSDGKQISQVRPLTDPGVALAAPLAAGDLQIEAAIVDRGRVVHKESASGVTVATYTPVPTPTPVFTPTPSPSPTPSFARLTVQNGPVNVRSGPGTGFTRLGEVQTGATYRITGKNEAGDWYQFNYSEDQQGWLAASFAAVSGPADAVAVIKVAVPTAAPVASKPAAAAPAPAAAGPSYPPAGGYFGYGVQIDPWGNRGAAIAATKGMGFGWVKVQIPWKNFEGSPGQKNFPDDIVGDLSGAGLNVLLSIVKAPDWARPGNTDRSVEGPPADNGTYADFVGAIAGHYKGRIKAIEVWNEQNLWYEWGREPLDPNRYVDLLCRAYRAIKAADPNIVVVAGAPTPTGVNDGSTAIDDVVYLQRMYAAGAKNCFDAVGSHPSGYNNPPDAKFGYNNPAEPSFKNHPSFFFRDTMERYRQVMVANGDAGKRIWPTEFGWASTGSPHRGYEYARENTPEEQAQFIVQAYQIAKSWGWVGPMFLWNLDYNITQPSTELAAFGIMGRPAQDALARMPK
jgi:hypothetical protein